MDINAIREKASFAFWAAVVEALTADGVEVPSGDFSPMQSVAWDQACTSAIIGWIGNNCVSGTLQVDPYDVQKAVGRLENRAQDADDLSRMTDIGGFTSEELWDVSDSFGDEGGKPQPHHVEAVRRALMAVYERAIGRC